MAKQIKLWTILTSHRRVLAYIEKINDKKFMWTLIAFRGNKNNQGTLSTFQRALNKISEKTGVGFVIVMDGFVQDTHPRVIFEY